MITQSISKIYLLVLLAFSLLLTTCPSLAALPTPLFTKLQNVPTLDLNQPYLESPDYVPLGLPITRPTPEQKHAIIRKNKTLAHCTFIGANIELDNQISTQEFLFTPSNTCIKPTRYQVKPFWILQQKDNKHPKVLIADKSHRIRIWQKDNYPYRRIESILKSTAPSRYTKQPIPVMCHGNWHFRNGSYHYQKDYVEVYRSDPMSQGKTWVVVEALDPYAIIDRSYNCPTQ